MTKDFNKYITKYGFNFEGAPSEDFIEAFKKIELFPASKKFSEYTKYSYNEDLDNFFSFLEENNIQLDKVNVINIQDYQAFLMEKFAARSVRRKLGILKRFLVFGYKTKFYSHSMAEWIKYPTVPKHHESSKNGQKGSEVRELDLETANILIEALDSVVITKRKEREVLKSRNRLLGYFLLTTGMRAREIVNLRWHNIIKIKERYYVEFRGKGNKMRKIPLSDTLLNEMDRYRKLLGYADTTIKEDHPMFVAFTRNKNEQMSYESLYQLIKKVVRYVEANKNISPHWFRHTFITTLLEQGTPLAVTKQLAGHASITTTNMYLERITESTLEKEFDKIDFGHKK